MQENRDKLKLILFLMTLGSSMYGIFTPIYYLDQGVSYQRIVSFMLFWCLGGVISGAFGNYIIHKFGIKSFIVSRGLFEPILVLLINNYPYLKYPPEIQGFFSGSIALAFWISMDSLTVKTTELGNRGKQQSGIYSGMWIASIIAPFIGGFIINWVGYSTLFILSLLLILLGGIISFKLKLDIPTTKKIKFTPNFKGDFGSHMTLVFLRGITFGMAGWLFPLIIYNLTKSVVILGTFGTIFSIIALVGNTISGYLIDKHHKKAILVFFLASFITWIITGFFSGKEIFFLLALISLFYNLINISLNVLFFNAIEKKTDMVHLVSERIVAFSIGGMLVFALHFIFSYNIIFIICGLSVALSIPFIKKA